MNIRRIVKSVLNESYGHEGQETKYTTSLYNLDDVRKSIPQDAPQEVWEKFESLWNTIKQLDTESQKPLSALNSQEWK